MQPSFFKLSRQLQRDEHSCPCSNASKISNFRPAALLFRSIIIICAASAAIWASLVHRWGTASTLQAPYRCAYDHGYEAQIVTTTPLMIYIENFLSAAETEHLVGISEQNFTHKLYVDEMDVQNKEAPSLAILSPQTAIVQCIQQRAQKFLGSYSSPEFELFSLIRYTPSTQVHPHIDGLVEPETDPSTGRLFNRWTSFFVYVSASEDLEGGETFFPRVVPPGSNTGLSKAIVPRKNSAGAFGTAFKPVTGSALFWIGLKPDGTPLYETLHQGLPVVKGEKIGMNIWAKYYLDEMTRQ